MEAPLSGRTPAVPIHPCHSALGPAGSGQKGHLQMGTHARPRRRVRAAAFGTLAVGATLTGVGLTAAALDQSGAALADGTLSTEPVNFAASGLGAPVPVADVSSLDGSSAGRSVVVTESGSSDGSGAGNGAVLGGYGGYRGHGEGGQGGGSKATGAHGIGR